MVGRGLRRSALAVVIGLGLVLCYVMLTFLIARNLPMSTNGIGKPRIANVVGSDAGSNHRVVATGNTKDDGAGVLSILVFFETLRDSERKFRSGGPGGELRVLGSLLESAKDLGFSVRLCPSPAELNAIHDFDVFDLIILDESGMNAFADRLPGAFTTPSIACRLRFLDFWGTPPEQNHIKLDLSQYLVPYPNPWNTFIGFRQEPIPAPTGERKRMGVLHGKEGRYWIDHIPLLERISQTFDLVATIPDERLGGLRLPSRVRNLGMVSRETWLTTLSQSRFVISFGDPVLAPTGVEAIAAGSAYIFAKYPTPRSISNIPAHPLRSQHDFLLDTLGEPYAYAVDVGDPGAVLNAIDKACRTTIPNHVPDLFTAETHRARTNTILTTDICASN